MNIQAEIQDKGLIATYAALKNVPLAKVLRNMARDFVQAAFKTTPLARISISPFVRVPIEGTKRTYHYIRWHSLDRKAKKRLKDRRVIIHRGWSKASWIQAMRLLGMNGKDGSPPQEKADLPDAVRQLATVGVTDKQAVITDEIHFDRRPGEADRILSVGFRAAPKRMMADFRKIMKAAQEGNKASI